MKPHKTTIISIFILISLVPPIILIFKALENPTFNTVFYFLGALLIVISPKIKAKLTLKTKTLNSNIIPKVTQQKVQQKWEVVGIVWAIITVAILMYLYYIGFIKIN